MSATHGSRSVPIHHQSHRFFELEVGPFRITELGFPAGSRIDPHHHDRPNVGVILGGSFDLGFGMKTFACEPGTAFVEPAGETHCNCMGCRGAWVLAIQPDPADADFADPGALSLDRPGHSRHPGVTQLARRIAREREGWDRFSPLVVQGLAFELIAAVGKADAGARHRNRAPRWLNRVEDRLRNDPTDKIGLSDLAREAGCHPAHLAREFRVKFGRSIGGFLRDRRLEWAAKQLVSTDRSIASIAIASGFADQSHFTRRFREYAGATPRRFRLARSRPAGAPLTES
jgi:AraC family transcriptional regulator